MQSQTWKVNAIQIGHRISSSEKFGVEQGGNDRDVVRLHFGLKGDYRFTYKELDQSFDLIGGHHNIMYSNGISLQVENKSLEIETFGVEFPKALFVEFTDGGDDLLKRFIDRVLAGKPTLLSKEWGTMKTPIQKVIDEIIMNKYDGSLQNIFLLSKCLELLVLCVDDYHKLLHIKPQYLAHKKDQERIIAARDFINTRLGDPPNLSEISKAIGLNEFKLKYGFKEMFGDTVFGYLTKRRLHHALQFLRDTQKTSAEIAYELGYSSPQHFSQQFKKKFGVTPNSIRKNPSSVIESN